MIDREKLSGAAKSGLNFVRDEKRSVFPAERLRAGEVTVAGNIDALALDRLDKERGDVA